MHSSANRRVRHKICFPCCLVALVLIPLSWEKESFPRRKLSELQPSFSAITEETGDSESPTRNRRLVLMDEDNSSSWGIPVRSPALSRRRLANLRGATTTSDVENAETSKQLIFKESSLYPPTMEATLTVPLHATTGTHHVHVYIGSPPQRQTLIVDTGSRLMAFPCRPCNNCGKHASDYYDPIRSTTDVLPKCGNCYLAELSMCSNNDQKCHVTQRYTEGSSWSAYELEDLVWFGNSNLEESIDSFMKLAVPYSFGCQVEETGLFKDQYADGILGLAKHGTSLIQAMYDAGSIRNNAFSLCFTRTGGSLSLGGSYVEQHREPMRFSPLTTTGSGKNMYSVNVVEVRVGDLCIACSYTSAAGGKNSNSADREIPETLKIFSDGKGTILDSGTTDTYLPAMLEPYFIKAWKETSGMAFPKRKNRYTYKDFQNLPKITFVLQGMGEGDKDGVVFVIKPVAYMEDVPIDATGNVVPWAGTTELTNRIYLEEQHGAVLGANAMLGYDILFDIGGQRVGMARADCSGSTSVIQ
eukprot:CAMPEP_0195289986 /NCGR_PEP_ID=MMETSP0707-20130614/6032_1 /TAXON_ID=33640 /ORGANISM="Asterionellopsis glacialis, Strain CCMP134" /LENGTH=527 /DNA_ID=CAMNT_0040350051 /DNA_START=229 /DNA_END=1815 /DNA_ORIENTATION=+